MGRLILIALCLAALVGCQKTGLSGDESRAQSEAWNQDAYEKAMIESGKEDELNAEKEKWAASNNGNQQNDDPEGTIQGGAQPN